MSFDTPFGGRGPIDMPPPPWGGGVGYGLSFRYAPRLGPGGRYAKDPGRPTNGYLDLGPGPIRHAPRGVSKYTLLCGAWGPVCHGPWELNKSTHLCGARGS